MIKIEITRKCSSQFLCVFFCSSSTATHEVRHYLQDGIIPMSHFQRSLPRLPIPKLEATCERYLASQRAMLDDTAYAEHAKLVKDFQSGQGKSR